MITDSFGRRVDYLRISLTDRCNLRCVYCMPKEGVRWKKQEDILSFEEIERFAAVAVEEGISKIRLTGGEPLVREGVAGHIRRLREATGIEKIALTTNGTLLARYAEELKKAGLSRVNISIDSLDPKQYKTITRGGNLQDVFEGIEAVLRLGMEPVKINTVVMPGSESNSFDFAKLTIDRPFHVRFIEKMPFGAESSVEKIGSCGAGISSFISSDEILDLLAKAGKKAGIGVPQPLSEESVPEGWGPSRYFRYPGALGTVCVISPLSRHFCNLCNRLRLTADGRLRPCLFSDKEFDVKDILRNGTDKMIKNVIKKALDARPKGHGMKFSTSRGMSQIGG